MQSHPTQLEGLLPQPQPLSGSLGSGLLWHFCLDKCQFLTHFLIHKKKKERERMGGGGEVNHSRYSFASKDIWENAQQAKGQDRVRPWPKW